MSSSYKSAKEAFVSHTTGSSIIHVNLISLVALASVSLYAALRTRLPLSRPIPFVLAWLVLVFPLLLSMTLFASRPVLLSLMLFIPTAMLMVLLPRKEVGTPLPLSPAFGSGSTDRDDKNAKERRLPLLPALTTYRAHMLLMTTLAILAVDFPVFPRSLAKCETFGVSLMDLGVGSFVFSQGIVSALPILRNSAYLTGPLMPKFLSITRNCLPIAVLGLVRVLLVKSTEYPEHVTEYGVHWNFFLTLAILPIFQVLLHPIIARVPISLIGTSIAMTHQMLLSHGSLQSYVLFAPRTTLLSMNKEGIISLPGYLAIHILGLSVGTMILPPSPSFFRRRQRALARSAKDATNSRQSPVSDNLGQHDLFATRHTGKTATELCSYAIVWWSLLFLAKLTKIGGKWYADDGGGVSRRMVNIPYILWVAAFNTSFLLSYLVVLDLCFFPGPAPRKSKSKSLGVGSDNGLALDKKVSNTSLGEENPAPLLEAINKHGLSLFLVANVLTGLVNLSMNTMYASNALAVTVLCTYAFGLCALVWMWDGRRRKTWRH